MTRSIFVVAVLAVTACTPPIEKPDAGPDSGINVDPMNACSGGCAVNQVCDTTRRICVDGCPGGCDGGICQKTPAGAFQCIVPAVTCGTTTCDPGQVACLGGDCQCLGPARGTFDSCFGDPRFPGSGQVCKADGTCGGPKVFQQCKTDGEPCPAGSPSTACNPVFGDNYAVCTQPCQQNTECDKGEFCSQDGCLPSGLFGGQECAIQIDAGVTDDAGVHVLSFQTVTVGSKCLKKDNMGNAIELEPSGTCTYAFFYFADIGPYPFTTCRPAGGVQENNECLTDARGPTASANQCATALECAGMRGGNKGLCLRTCNALTPSVTYPSPQPACPMTESCVNLYRREDTGHEGALLGVCAKKCNIFDTASTCPMLGTVQTICVPTNVDGRVVVSSDGSGICLPQRETIAQLDALCDTTDPFQGASCGAGQVCPPAGASSASVCTQICDTTCDTDAGTPPARCATEANARCPAGKKCNRVTTTTGARVGFCQ